MTHRHDLPPGLGPLTSLTHTHDGHTHSHVSGQVPDAPAQRLHLHGVVLPDGDERDLWLHDGVISLEPVADAITVATSGWIMPGLVDAHCHVGLEAHGAVGQVLEVAVPARVVHQPAGMAVHVVQPEQHETAVGVHRDRVVERVNRGHDTLTDPDVVLRRLAGRCVDHPTAADHEVWCGQGVPA